MSSDALNYQWAAQGWRILAIQQTPEVRRLAVVLSPILPGVLLLCLLASLPMSAHAAGDPTRPPGWTSETSQAVTAPVQNLVLQQIIVGKRQVAVINGKVLTTGDRIEGQRVIRIRPEGVELNGSRGRQTLTLARAGIKTPADARNTPNISAAEGKRLPGKPVQKQESQAQ